MNAKQGALRQRDFGVAIAHSRLQQRYKKKQESARVCVSCTSSNTQMRHMTFMLVHMTSCKLQAVRPFFAQPATYCEAALEVAGAASLR